MLVSCNLYLKLLLAHHYISRDTGYYWAQLIYNGEIICSAQTKYEIGVLSAGNTVFTLSGCAVGYDVKWNFDTNDVNYAYGSYSSGFGTVETQLEAGYYQYVANVWGCA